MLNRRKRPSAADASAHLQPMSHFAPFLPRTRPQIFIHYLPHGEVLGFSDALYN